MSEISFLKCTKKDFDITEVEDFVKELQAVSFKRCKTKNINGHWQIACFDKKSKLLGFIICHSQKLRLEIFERITK